MRNVKTGKGVADKEVTTGENTTDNKEGIKRGRNDMRTRKIREMEEWGEGFGGGEAKSINMHQRRKKRKRLMKTLPYKKVRKNKEE